MANRIFWSDEEKARIVERVFSMRQNDPESSLTAIVNRAVSQLPEERQRQIPSVKAIPWLPEAIKAKFAEQRELVRDHEKATTTAESAEQRHGALKDQLQRMVDNARNEALAEADLGTLLMAVVERLQQSDDAEMKLLKARVEQLERALSARASSPATPAPAPEKRKPSILVVGMLPNQNRELVTHFGKDVNLIFMDRDDEKGKVPGAAAAVVNAKFIKHTLQARIQSELHGRAKVYLLKGGLSAVKERVEEVLKELGCRSTK